MGKTVVVTGAAGFLGRELVRQLKQESTVEKVIAFDNYDPLCGSSEEGMGEIHFGDVCNPPGILFAKDPPTHIIHLAALGRNLTCERNPYRAWQVNVNGTIAMLEIARAYKARTIVCSSNIVLSNQPTVYRFTKRTVEELAQTYSRFGLPVMVLRPSNIAGPGQSRTEFQPCAFAGMDVSFEEKGYIEITGDGRQTRDFVNVKDVARAFVYALDRLTTGLTMDICTGIQISMNDITRMLGVPVRHVAERAGDARALVSDKYPAYALMGFKAMIDIEQTVSESFPSVMDAKTSHTR